MVIRPYILYCEQAYCLRISILLAPDAERGPGVGSRALEQAVYWTALVSQSVATG